MLSGDLKPGDQLPPERELASAVNTSPLILRQALHALEAQGLLTIRKGAKGGAFAVEPGHQPLTHCLHTLLQFGKARLDHLTEARLALEPTIAGLVSIRRTEQQLDAIRENVARSRQKGRSNTEVRLNNLQFHRLLAESSGNPFFVASIDAIIDNLEYNIGTSRLRAQAVRNTVCHHEGILAALEAKDERSATMLMRVHVEEIQTSLKEKKSTAMK